MNSQLLMTDARIVAEDDAYIVVSLRVPKDVVHNNLALICSAMEASFDRKPRSWRLGMQRAAALLLSPGMMALNWAVTFALLAS
ncbi:hypothetical protein [Bradyrhizobium elkanii]|uniref:Uncharacterized protein n=1 Tax=Bradyrhizobium elkanii TaxID=29448 RepID=A0A8I1YB07_BRAEL|nr:hypothetical protein [Bradyrhizobium elkanii]MBP1296653.1 hypothetical protein [Bradyrhizobium elkanii]